MKKIITTVSAITLTAPSGADKATQTASYDNYLEDLEFVYANEESFKGSGFIDLSVEKTVLLAHDADNSGDITVGDELKYTVQVHNLDNVAASGVSLLDFLESKIELNLGTVAISQGAVISGNDFGDDTDVVYVDFGTIAANWFALVNFDVTVTNLQPGLNIISNSAEVFGPSGSFFISDDPSTPGFDPTMVDAYGAYPDLIFDNGFDFRGSGGF
ncbi:MAG: hypothetical protein R3E90_05830 [Marinicella sp.]|nr:hypothetical protein [Xanthomonadales bacterium]